MYALNRLDSYTYTPYDPRWKSQIDGRYMHVCEPVLDSSVRMKDVYNYRPGYKNVYNSYADIRGGQITYSIDPELARPYIPQLFEQAAIATVGVENYVDPMGNIKPHFTRSTRYGCPTKCGLSWVSDSNEHRADMLANQLWRRNQSEPMLYPWAM
jgi:hypothetical protein